MRVVHVCLFDDPTHTHISKAIEYLGHEVSRVNEIKRRRLGLALDQIKADVCILHDWREKLEIQDVRIPKVFWTLTPYNHEKKVWASYLLEKCLLGFGVDEAWPLRLPGEVQHLPLPLDPDDYPKTCGELMKQVSEKLDSIKPKTIVYPLPYEDDWVD